MSRFQCVAIVGIGLMGGSLGLALRQRQLAESVVGIDTNADALTSALSIGAINRGTTDLSAGVCDADMVVFATPTPLIPALMAHAAPHLRPNVLVTDLGSVKGTIVADGSRLFGARFVGGHPMAGSECSGVQAARAALFEGAAWAIVRPEPFTLETDAEAERLAELVRALGAKPVALAAAQHDRLVALVSHLPHALSFAFAQTIADDAESGLARALAAGSYRDMMRVSRSDPELWHAIFLANRPSLLDALTAFEEQLAALRLAVETTDTEGLRAALTAPKNSGLEQR